MSNTTAMRTAWANDLCGKMPAGKFKFWNGTTININRRAAQAFQALDNVLRKYAYGPRPADTGASVCRKITGGEGYSLHSYGIAVDINWLSNPYQKPYQYLPPKHLVLDLPMGMVNEIKLIETIDGLKVWGWGGDYSQNKDTMHFELHVTPDQLAKGIRDTISPPIPPSGHTDDPSDPTKKEIEMITCWITNRDGHAEYLAVNPDDGTVDDWWQNLDGTLSHLQMGDIKGVNTLESYYDKDVHCNIVRAVGYLLSPWILFRFENETGHYEWGDWIPWQEWQKFAAAMAS